MEALREIRDALEAVRRSAGQEEPINRSEAQRIFAVLAKLRTESGARKAPLHTVFEYLVLQGLSGEQTARQVPVRSLADFSASQNAPGAVRVVRAPASELRVGAGRNGNHG